MPSLRKQCSGFTLLEVLLALAIMTMLSLSGYLILDGVLRSEAQQREHLDKLRKIQRGVLIVDKDFQQIMPRTYRNERITYPMFSMSPNWVQSDSGRLAFVRGGWQNPQAHFNRSHLQLVAYRVKDRVLERLYWPHLDASHNNATQVVMPLFHDVKSFKITAYTNRRWQHSWQNKTQLPQAVRLTIQFEKQGELQRVYAIP